jgi:pimeloyl-ACP methyl ester carboxylesterase
VAPKNALIVGLSVGTYPAIYLANKIGARLCAVAPADRADLMTWQSPAARIIKRRAIQKGYRLSHYARAMAGCHPAHNLERIAPDSTFVVGLRDPFIPPRRRAAILDAVERHLPSSSVVTLEAGHFATLMAGGRHQLSMLGLAPPRRWRMPKPLEWSFAWLSASASQS